MESFEDRQLKPIYAALEINSLKTAVQHCNKLLKKRANWDVVKALKALALQRGLKSDEAAALCDEVIKNRPTDENTLLALNMVLRPLGRLQDIVALYDAAYKKHPDNEEIGAQAFLAMVKVRSWKTSQQVGLKLWKTFKEDRYLYWYLMSVTQQANGPDTPPGTRIVLLNLAARYLATASTPSWMAVDRFYLHLNVLIGLEDLATARQLIASDKGEELCRNSLILERTRAEMAKKVGDFEGERRRAMKRLENGDSNWATFLALLDSVFQLLSEGLLLSNGEAISGNGTPTGTSGDQPMGLPPSDPHLSESSAMSISSAQLIDDVQSLLTRLMDTAGRKERAPFMASMELERRVREHGLRTNGPSLLLQMKNYLDLFADKACCFEDLKPYVEAITESELVDWALHLQSRNTDLATVQSLEVSLNVLKLLRYRRHDSAGRSNAVEEALQADEYLRLYWQALPLGKSLPAVELQPADELALLAGQSFVAAWAIDGQEKYLQNAACALESALQRSEKAYQLRLLLITIYRLLGASSLALENYRRVGVKTIQNETLSHIVLNRASTFSLCSNGDLSYLSECIEASGIYGDNWTETGEMITKGFQFEKYSQIPDFLEFEERLENSLQRDLIRLEHLRMRLTHEVLGTADITNTPLELQDLETNLQRVHHNDNRDFTVIQNLQPLGLDIVEQTSMGPVCKVNWLKVFSKCYMRALRALFGDLSSSEKLAQEVLEHSEFTSEERSLIGLSDELAAWLAPLAPVARGFGESLSSASPLNGHTQEQNSAPNGPESPAEGEAEADRDAALDASKRVVQFFEERVSNLKRDATAHALTWELLHIASIALEGFVLLDMVTFPFRAPGGRTKRGDPIFQSVKVVRAKAVDSMKEVSANLLRLASDAVSQRQLDEFDAHCGGLCGTTGFKHESMHAVGKKMFESRKKVLEGIGRGILRRCT